MKFQAALKSISEVKNPNPEQGFGILQSHFIDIDGAGINLLTEILQTLDCNQFVVMNQNSISGLRMAGFLNFPRNPSKITVQATQYSEFCQSADYVRRELGLSNFLELDALFNYVYWKVD